MNTECSLCGSREHSEEQHWDCCELLLDGSRGIYLPQEFASRYRTEHYGVTEEQREILLYGPEHGLYWEVWDEVLSEASFTDPKGRRYYLYQDGDLWLVPETL